MNKRITAGIFSLLLAANVLAGCTAKNNTEVTPVTETSVTTLGDMDDYFSLYAETEPDIEVSETAMYTEETALSTATDISKADILDADKNADEIQKVFEEPLVVNNNNVDIEAIYDYIDFDVLYYMAEHKKADKETVLEYFKSNQSDNISSLSMVSNNEAVNEIIDISPLTDEKNSYYRRFLEAETEEEIALLLEETFNISAEDTEDNTAFDSEENEDGLFSSFIPFSEVKEQFDIKDVYCVTLKTTSPTKNDDSEDETGFSMNFDMDTTFYVFKIGDKWKVDLPYTMENKFITLFAGLSQAFSSESDNDGSYLLTENTAEMLEQSDSIVSVED